jgi:integrase
MKRYKTDYPGIFYREGKRIDRKGIEKIYYAVYKKDEKVMESKIGRQYADAMTPAKASIIRGELLTGKRLTRKENRKLQEAQEKVESNKYTISLLWKEYKENKPDLKGIVTDQNRFDLHIKPSFGKKEPSELFPLDVDRLRLKLLKKKAPGTVKNVLELLRRIINFGVNKNLCPGLNFKIELPKVNNLRTEDLNPAQLKSLLEAIENDPNIIAGNMMKMALFTGMRRSEMFRLKWTDINFEKGFITLVDTKSGQDQQIPLNDAVRELLKGHPRSRSVYVFPGRKGRLRVDIKHQVNRIKTAAGLPKDFRALHGLRHVFASMLASSGEVDL